MEQNENKNVETAEATQVSHEETRKKLKKQRVRQIVASLIGVAILAFGLWKIVCLFLDYNSNETSNDAQIEQYISPVNLRASGYIAKVTSENIRKYTREIPSLCSTTGSIASV